MPWNPFLIGYLKQCLWLLIIHDDPWRVLSLRQERQAFAWRFFCFR